MEKYGLKNINELRELLGYKDIRTVRSWCKENGLPIMTIGKKEYLNESMLDITLIKVFKNSMIQFGIKEDNADEMLKAILADDKSKLAGIMSTGNDYTSNFNLKQINGGESELNGLISKYKNKVA